jgi:hypothetical protein
MHRATSRKATASEQHKRAAESASGLPVAAALYAMIRDLAKIAQTDLLGAEQAPWRIVKTTKSATAQSHRAH